MAYAGHAGTDETKRKSSKMYAVYRMKKDGTEINYTRFSRRLFEFYAEALDFAQLIYEEDPRYKVEVRYELTDEKEQQ